MSTAHDFLIPEFQLGDRMALALRSAGHSVNDAAAYLDVNRHTVSRWLNGNIAPSLATQRLWAFWTGVPLQWLQTGQAPDPQDGGGNEVDTLRLGITPAAHSGNSRFALAA